MMWTLVTGAATGLGASIVKGCAKKGWPVVIHYRNSGDEARDLCEKVRSNGGVAETIQGDFSSEESLGDFTQRYESSFSKTRFLINNVGNYFVAPSYVTTRQVWRDLFHVNFHAAVAITQNLLPSLKQTGGAVVNIGVAGVGRSRGDRFSPAYMASKEALWSYTRSLAKEQSGVRVNMVSPGYMENSVDINPEKGKVASFEEVTRAVLFCLEEKVTGQNLGIAEGVRL